MFRLQLVKTIGRRRFRWFAGSHGPTLRLRLHLHISGTPTLHRLEICEAMPIFDPLRLPMSPTGRVDVKQLTIWGGIALRDRWGNVTRQGEPKWLLLAIRRHVSFRSRRKEVVISNCISSVV